VLECALSPDEGVLAAALSNCMLKTYDSADLRQVGLAVSLLPEGAPAGSHRIVSIGWSVPTPSMLYAACGSSDGWDELHQSARRGYAALHGIDTRSGRVESTWSLGGSAGDAGELSAMACSPSGTLVAVGKGSDVLFLDVRKGGSSSGGGGGGGSASAASAALLDRFSSHSDCVTCLAWHPTLPNHALSGSEDGLVNVYDCAVAGEEDALVSTLSVGESVSHFGVFGPSGALAHVATRTGLLSLWNLGSATKLAEFRGMREGVPNFAFLLSAHWCADSGRLCVLGGGHGGELHFLDATLGGCALLQSLPAGRPRHTASARCAAGDGRVRRVFTGGEDGRVCLWALGAEDGGGGAAPLGSKRLPRGSPDAAAVVDEAAGFGRLPGKAFAAKM
jgi:WD40 repeat protein